jgi:acyl-CoA synthetase (AMP-forming)/AMP-acid ligase II
MTPARDTDCTQRSDELHARVQHWIQSAPASREPFNALALAIARFQADFNPGYRRLLQAWGSQLDTLDSIIAVPADAFRLSRMAVHSADADAVRYVTSGTTSSSRGTHAMRRTDTYRTSAIAAARPALLAGTGHAAVVALLPSGTTETSSLAAMAQMFMDEFEPPLPTGTSDCHAPSPWLLDAPDVVAALVAHLDRARALDKPLLVVATTLALVQLLHLLGDTRLDQWPQVVVMPTGGAKGKAQDLDPSELRSRVMKAFGIAAHQVVGEYGMTELSSQLYEAHPTRKDINLVPGVYYAPAWLHVCPVDGETLRPVPAGEAGLARFIDLANIDSAVCVVTQDLIRAHAGGFELVGRQTGAPARGCSLSTEEWLRAHDDT